MKIKQETLIEKFLIKELGEEKGSSVLEKQKDILDKIIKNTKNKSKNQMKTLVQTILPRIALFKALLEKGISKEESYKIVQKYMMDIVGKEKNDSMKKMEKVPCFYFLYSNIFLSVVRKTDLWKSTQEKGKDYFKVTMKKCLWHDACVENDCADLCRLFCDVDNCTYANLKN